MTGILKKTLFALFFLSGAASLLYQVVWLRLAFASFGIITPVMSVTLSVFMLGLAVGSWGAGRWVAAWQAGTGRSAILLYALAELLIGVGAFAVPRLFRFGEGLLLPAGQLDSAAYLSWSAAIIALAILPWCICMGATFPLMMAFVRERDDSQKASFSFLYLANVIGAMCGTLAPLVLVELLGFSGALLVAACANFFIATCSLVLGIQSVPERPVRTGDTSATEALASAGVSQGWLTSAILLTTGLVSLALEVVWTRAFTPVLRTQVYSFASLVFMYLLATWAGSWLYRRHLAQGRAARTGVLMSFLALAAIGQIVAGDPRWQVHPVVALFTIFPFCGLLGYLTPKLIDEYSAGTPGAAGRAYAINVVGCIVGPLAASYLLLPAVGVKWSMVLLAAPILVLAAVALFQMKTGRRGALLAWAGTLACLPIACLYSTSFEERFTAADALILRDHTATVISHGKGMKHLMYVNGISITYKTPITKVMAHLPLAFLEQPPESALVICFGMGTTLRSLSSWGIEVTAIELVPSVRDSFVYFFEDAAKVAGDPKNHIEIDDGRRFLNRSRATFDVITLDPPPPIEAAGSSLLYSTEFYDAVKSRLAQRGILHAWFPGKDSETFDAVLRSVLKSFPHVKVFQSFEGWGFHMLASREPLKTPTADEMLARMPENARRDLMEWTTDRDLPAFLADILGKELSPHDLLQGATPTFITDDRPFNEYYLLRWLRQRLTGGSAAD